MRTRASLIGLGLALLAMSAAAQVTGSGTAGTVPVFTGSGTSIGNSSAPITVSSTGNVGIGTIAPAYKLDVSGPIHSSTGGIVFPDGSTQTTASANVISGTNQINQVNGNVGIGTATPKAKLNITTAATGNYPTLGTSTGNVFFGGDNNLYGLYEGSISADGNSWLQVMRNDSATAYNLILQPAGGNVGIGTTSPGATVPGTKLEVNGGITLTTNSGGAITFQDGTKQSTAYTGVTCTGADYAEAIDVTGDRTTYEPGDLLVLDPNAPGKFLKSNQSYSTLVAGIYSTKPGFVGRKQPATPESSATEVPMAMVGRVPTKVSAENGPIKVGDLLVTSSTPGYAMKGTDRSLLTGAVVGKAMGPLDSGTGTIEVLVTLQ
jgi:hypothetical protein